MCGRPSGDERHEPDDHDRPEDRADAAGAATLHQKQPDQDDDGDRHDERLEDVRRDAKPFDRAQHRDRRRDHAVAVEQRRAEQADRDERRGGTILPPFDADQRDQRQDAALALVVGAHHEQQVLDRHRDDQRPEDQRQHAEDVAGVTPGSACDAGEAFAQRVERARADVAVDDAERGEDEERDARLGLDAVNARSGRFALRFEANLDAELAILAIVEGSKRRRRDIGLHVGRQERAERIIGPDANPRAVIADLEAMLDAEIDASVGRKPPIVPRVPRNRAIH